MGGFNTLSSIDEGTYKAQPERLESWKQFAHQADIAQDNFGINLEKMLGKDNSKGKELRQEVNNQLQQLVDDLKSNILSSVVGAQEDFDKQVSDGEKSINAIANITPTQLDNLIKTSFFDGGKFKIDNIDTHPQLVQAIMDTPVMPRDVADTAQLSTKDKVVSYFDVDSRVSRGMGNL